MFMTSCIGTVPSCSHSRNNGDYLSRISNTPSYTSCLSKNIYRNAQRSRQESFQNSTHCSMNTFKGHSEPVLSHMTPCVYSTTSYDCCRSQTTCCVDRLCPFDKLTPINHAQRSRGGSVRREMSPNYTKYSSRYTEQVPCDVRAKYRSADSRLIGNQKQRVQDTLGSDLRKYEIVREENTLSKRDYSKYQYLYNQKHYQEMCSSDLRDQRPNDRASKTTASEIKTNPKRVVLNKKDLTLKDYAILFEKKGKSIKSQRPSMKDEALMTTPTKSETTNPEVKNYATPIVSINKLEYSDNNSNLRTDANSFKTSSTTQIPSNKSDFNIQDSQRKGGKPEIQTVPMYSGFRKAPHVEPNELGSEECSVTYKSCQSSENTFFEQEEGDVNGSFGNIPKVNIQTTERNPSKANSPDSYETYSGRKDDRQPCKIEGTCPYKGVDSCPYRASSGCPYRITCTELPKAVQVIPIKAKCITLNSPKQHKPFKNYEESGSTEDDIEYAVKFNKKQLKQLGFYTPRLAPQSDSKLKKFMSPKYKQKQMPFDMNALSPKTRKSSKNTRKTGGAKTVRPQSARFRPNERFAIKVLREREELLHNINGMLNLGHTDRHCIISHPDTFKDLDDKCRDRSLSGNRASTSRCINSSADLRYYEQKNKKLKQLAKSSLGRKKSPNYAKPTTTFIASCM